MRRALGIGVGVMAAAVAYGLLAGDLWGEAPILLKYPWFHVSMIDLYVGFALVAGWIAYREHSLLVTVLWIVLLLLLGNLVSCGYALLAVIRADGDMRRFWLGKHAGTP
jgi:hypothetical protein